jgi:hypothetical protein
MGVRLRKLRAFRKRDDALHAAATAARAAVKVGSRDLPPPLYPPIGFAKNFEEIYRVEELASMKDVHNNQSQFLEYRVPAGSGCASGATESLFPTGPDDKPLLSFVKLTDTVKYLQSDVNDLRAGLHELTRASSEDSVKSMVLREPIKGIGGKDVLVGLLTHLKQKGFACGRAWSAKSTAAALARCLMDARNGAAYKADQPAPATRPGTGAAAVHEERESGAAAGVDERDVYRSELRRKTVNVLKAECKDQKLKSSGK